MGGLTQVGHLLQGLLYAQPRRWCRDRQTRNDLSVGRGYGDRKTDHARNKLFVVGGNGLFPNARQIDSKAGGIGNGVVGVPRQVHQIQEFLLALRREETEEQLPDRGAMDRHLRAGSKRRPKGQVVSTRWM